MSGRSFFVPEVIQTSLMDCGPAALKAVLEGFGIRVGYDTIRERCQTDVDGTSMDALAALGRELGLETAHILAPRDNVLLPEADCLPAIVVTRSSSGALHFLVVWSVVGPFVQIMDPAGGRRFVHRDTFITRMPDVPIAMSADRFRRWAGTEDARRPIAAKMRRLRVGASTQARVFALADADPSFRAYASLDAAVRMTGSLVLGGAVSRGRGCERLLEELMERATTGDGADAIPRGFFWANEGRAPGKLLLKGAVLVHVARRRDGATAARAHLARPEAGAHEEIAIRYRDRAHTPDDDAAPTSEPCARTSPAADEARSETSATAFLWRAARASAPHAAAIVLSALAVSSLVATLDTLILRDLFDAARSLTLAYQRAAGLAILVAFVAVGLALDLFVTGALQRIGRAVEARLRVALLEKLPRLEDRYLRSRPTSDMAARGHAMHQLREAPQIAGRIARAIFSFAATIGGIVWLDRKGAALAVLAALVGIVVPYALKKPLAESTMRLRTHAASLDRFYLDAMLGVVPVRLHGAERAVRREHESLLVEWADTARAVHRQTTLVQALQSLFGTAIVAVLVARYILGGGAVGGLLLLVYWALRLPGIGQELVAALLAWRNVRNVAVRLLAPLGAREVAGVADEQAPRAARAHGGMHVALDDVSVRAGGHTLLSGVSVEIAAGEHVAIVGASGAGKSSLVSLLLGWLEPARGSIRVDGEELTGERVAQLRAETAWVDPAVSLWNRSLHENVAFGAGRDATLAMPGAIAAADLADVLERLPSGLQTELGEGGACVSGGQGQRVRLARALMRRDARLVVLDEPFRGLDRERRRDLARRARAWWKDATILFVSHDVGDIDDFDRVLVVENGAVIEDGAPRALSALPTSRYRALAEADRATRESLWSRGAWRRLRMTGGVLTEERSGR